MAVGFVVAGGRSRRMGRDKARLAWPPDAEAASRTTLLDHAVARLGAVCDDVRILCGPEPRYADRGLPVVLDAIADAGPLAGVLAGLESLPADASPVMAGLFLAVDVPLVPPPLLRRLLELLSGHDAAVPVLAAGPEPLCAAYSAACAAPIRRRVDAGERKMTCFWPDVRVREVRDEELRAFGDPRRLFWNLNTPEDAQDAGLQP